MWKIHAWSLVGSEPHSQAFRLPMKLFATPAAPQRLDAYVAGYIVELQAPNSAPEVPVYNFDVYLDVYRVGDRVRFSPTSGPSDRYPDCPRTVREPPPIGSKPRQTGELKRQGF